MLLYFALRLQVSSDFTHFATASDDGSVKLWDLQKLDGRSLINKSRQTYTRQGNISHRTTLHLKVSLRLNDLSERSNGLNLSVDQGHLVCFQARYLKLDSERLYDQKYNSVFRLSKIVGGERDEVAKIPFIYETSEITLLYVLPEDLNYNLVNSFRGLGENCRNI